MVKDHDNQRKKTIRQTDVPSCSLAEAIKLPKVLADEYAFKPATPLEVAAGLGVQPTTSGFRMLCGASAAYGLTIGGYNTATIELTDIGLKIVRPLKEGEDAIAKKEAILKPRVINEFLTKYSGAALPRKDIAINVLVTMGVPRDKTEEVFNLILESAELVGIIREIKNKKYIDLKNINIPKIAEANDAIEEEEGKPIPELVIDKDDAKATSSLISPEVKKTSIYFTREESRVFRANQKTSKVRRIRFCRFN